MLIPIAIAIAITMAIAMAMAKAIAIAIANSQSQSFTYSFTNSQLNSFTHKFELHLSVRKLKHFSKAFGDADDEMPPENSNDCFGSESVFAYDENDCFADDCFEYDPSGRPKTIMTLMLSPPRD